MPMWVQSSDEWFWAFFRDEFSEEDWDRKYMPRVSEFLDNCPEGSIAVHMLYDAQSLSPVQREQMADVLNNSKNVTHVAGSALVSNSMVVRGIMTAINWLSKKPFPESIFKRPGDAVTWLGQQSSVELAQELEESLYETVPKEYRWPDFGRSRVKTASVG